MKQRLQNRRREMSKVNYKSEESDEWDDDSIVLQVNGAGEKPFMMEVLMCGKKFLAIIDTGSPVSIFAVDELERIIGKYWVVVREMIDAERYVVICVSIQVGKTEKLKAILLVGRYWLTALKYKIEQPMTQGENTVKSISCESVDPEIKLSPEAEQLVEEFPNLFKKRGRVNNYKIKIDMKDGTRATQEKGRRIPLQLQDQVDKEIKHQLEQGHIEKKGYDKRRFYTTGNDNCKERSFCKNSTRRKSVKQLNCKKQVSNAEFGKIIGHDRRKNKRKRRESMVLLSRHEICVWTGTFR